MKSIIQNNHYGRIRLTSAGTRIITKQDVGGRITAPKTDSDTVEDAMAVEASKEEGKKPDPRFRILGEALPLVLPYIEPSTIIEVDVKVMRVLVENYYPLCRDFEDPFQSIIEARGTGCHVVWVKAVNDGDVK